MDKLAPPGRLRAWAPAVALSVVLAPPFATAQEQVPAGEALGAGDALGEAALFQEVPMVTAASKYAQDPREALSGVRGFFTR